MTEPLSARNLARYGLRRGAYDGANRRRFVLFEADGKGNEIRREFDTKGERDTVAMTRLAELSQTHDYRVTVNYQTPTGNAASWQGIVTARDHDDATDKANAIVRRTRRVLKIDGGDVEELPDAIPVPRAILARIADALGEAESFMSGFVGDDCQEEPVDDTVEELGRLGSELDKLLPRYATS